MTLLIRIGALVLLGGGIALLMLGYNAHQSTASDFARAFTGSPTKQAVLLLTGGGALVLAGVALIGAPTKPAKGRRKRA